MPRDIVDPNSWPPPNRNGERRVRVFRNLEFDVVASDLDPEACAQVARMLELSVENPQEGVDLRPRAALIATHPMVRRWQEISDAMTERSRYAGPIELVSKRRTGILRQLTGAEAGLPLEGPGVLLVKPGEEIHYGVLEDELEYHLIRVYRRTTARPYRVPVKSVLNSKDVRALLGWTWYHFERYFRTHTQDPTGRILIPGSREYAFDSEKLARYIYENSL